MGQVLVLLWMKICLGYGRTWNSPGIETKRGCEAGAGKEQFAVLVPIDQVIL